VFTEADFASQAIGELRLTERRVVEVGAADLWQLLKAYASRGISVVGIDNTYRPGARASFYPMSELIAKIAPR